MADAITLRVISPERVVLDTVASSVKIPGLDGLIGILPSHAPMVAALGPGPLSFESSGKAEELFVSGGFAEVRQDTLRIISEAAESPSDIDVDRAERAAERARDRLRARMAEGVPIDVLRAEAALRRALMRQRVAGRR